MVPAKTMTSLLNTNPDLAKEWHPTKNETLTQRMWLQALTKKYGGVAAKAMNGKLWSKVEIMVGAARIVLVGRNKNCIWGVIITAWSTKSPQSKVARYHLFTFQTLYGASAPLFLGIGLASVNQYGECDAHLIPFSQWYPHRLLCA